MNQADKNKLNSRISNYLGKKEITIFSVHKDVNTKKKFINSLIKNISKKYEIKEKI